MVLIGINEFIYVASIMFLIGLLGVLLRRNTIVIFMSIELMLNAINLALVSFSRFNNSMDGSIFVFFIMTVAAAEVALGLAIIVMLYRQRQTILVNELKQLNG